MTAPVLPRPGDELGFLCGTEIAGSPALGCRYRVERAIGEGAQSVVFLATRLAQSGEDLAVLKVWRPSFVRQDGALAALTLRKESVSLARLNEQTPPTPFVVRMIDHGEIARADGPALPWIGLEYVHGGPLGTSLKARIEEALSSTGVALSPSRARRLLGHVAAGLAAIHEVNVVHRDLKPSNVLVCGTGDDELAKVADLGVARAMGMHTTFGASLKIGSVGYAAPEQRHDDRMGPWSDVFSLAAVAYLAITGERMFAGALPAVLAAIHQGRFTPLDACPRVHQGFRKGDLLPRIEAVLRQAVRADPLERTHAVPALWTALEPLLVVAERDPLPALPSRALPSRVRTLLDSARRPWIVHASHRSTADLGIRAVAIDPDGHATAATASGLRWWDGARWLPLAAPPGVRVDALTSLFRVGLHRWLGFGDELVRFSPRQRDERQRVGEPGARVVAACVVPGPSFAIASHAPGRPVALYAHHGGRWAAPVSLPPGVVVAALAPAGARGFHLAGCDEQGHGILWTWHLDTGALERRPPVSARLSALAAAGPDTVCAAGERGTIVSLREGRLVTEPVPSSAAVGHVAIDVAGSVWAAAPGQLLLRAAGPGPGAWTVAWSDPGCERRFVGLAALPGMVVAVAEDGSIVTGRQG